jgi:ABC-type multidrug transport system permease subunit
MVIRRISPLSCAKVAGTLYALMGLLIGVCVSLFFLLLGSQIDSAQMRGPIVGLLFGAGAVIVLPIFYGVLGFVTTAIFAVLYNLTAGLVGGIEVDVDQVGTAPQ